MERAEVARLLSAATFQQRHHINELLSKIVASRVVQRGACVFDVGASSGFHTRHLSDLVGEAGTVHAFEPHPMHWGELLKLGNVRLWPFAAGNKCSMETLFAPVQHELSASLHDPRSWIGQDVEMRTVSVGQVQIDQIEEAKRLPVAFVKLDVERHEYAALIGMRSLLNRDKPVILLEGANREIEAFLLELGYRKYRLDHALVEEGRSVGEDAGLPNTIFLDRKRDVELVAPSLDEVSALVVDTTRPES